MEVPVAKIVIYEGGALDHIRASFRSACAHGQVNAT